MSVNKQPSFDDVLDLLRILDDSFIGADGATTQFLEVRAGMTGEGVNVNGNLGGLVHLARLVLEVAGKGIRWCPSALRRSQRIGRMRGAVGGQFQRG
jgi:hypothetical protein